MKAALNPSSAYVLSLIMLLALWTEARAFAATPDTEVAEIRWPKLKPLVALDDAVKLGLYVRPNLDYQNPTAYHVAFPSGEVGPDGLPRYRHSFVSIPQYPAGARGPLRVVGVVSVDLARAFSERIDDILRGLFSSSTISPTPDSSNFEILAVADMSANWQEDDNSEISGLEVNLQLEFVTSAGERIDLVLGSGTAGPEKAMYWSNITRWRSIGQRALSTALDEIVAKVRASRPFALHLGKLAEARALPAKLETIVGFEDRAALLPNGRLDAGEEGFVTVQITNRGPGPAYDVAARILSDSDHVAPAEPRSVGTLAPGGRGELTFPLAGRIDLPAGLLRLRVETTEKRGYDSRPVILEVATEALRTAKLEIVDVAWNDGAGRARGDGDGQPANGETLEAIVRVRNAGPGDAAGVVVSIAPSKPGLELLEPRVVVQRIAANEVAEARLLVRLPLAYDGAGFQLTFDAEDARGAGAGRTNRIESWLVRAKRPSLGVSHRVYDGNSPGSVGNRDGRVNNGERIELVLTPFNHGELPAREIRVTAAAEGAGLLPQPSSLTVGSLPAQTEGSEERLTLDVPRTFGRDSVTTEIRLTLTVSQQDFPPAREQVALAFRFQRPEIAIDVTGTERASRGAQEMITFQARNSGDLTAEDVVIEIGATGSGVELLDERGIPNSKRRFAIGTLAPQAATQRLSLPLLVKHSAVVGPAPLSVAVLQRDFPATTRVIDLSVAEGEVPVIAAVPPMAARPRDSTSGDAAPATISFLRYATGEHLTDEAIILRFEVQARVEPADVRLTQNGGLLPLERAGRTIGTIGSLKVLQYEVPVQLTPGENHFEVVVVTGEGIRSDRPLSLIREWQKGRLWVVAIGVGAYSDPAIEGLQFAAADAIAIHRYFRETFALPAGQAFLRTDGQATLREIKSLLGTQLAARADNPDDTVILYFAGHGLAEDGAGSPDADRLTKYLLPHDSSLADPYSTALDMDEVTNIVRRLVPDRVVIIIDSCFSGAAGGRSPLNPREGRRRAVVTAEFLDRMGHLGRGRVVLTASGPEEVARERADLGHGVFTYYVLKGLRGDGDANLDGEIDVDELYRYAWEHVSVATAGKQHPVKKAPESVGSIVIGRSPGRAPRAPGR